MKILVTGGCGFIGSNFIIHTLRKYPGDSIINLDKLTYAGNPVNLAEINGNPNYSFVRGDICDRKLVPKVMDSCDAVVNFAAESHVDRSITGPEPFLQTNFLGVGVILEACRQLKIPRFIQISTDECYGSIAQDSADEQAPLRPSSPYSASKAAADLLCLAYHTTYHLPVLITRSTNNYGPRQYPEKLIPLFFSLAFSGKPVPLYGNGENQRDWLFVEDNCRAIDLVLRQGKEGLVYNIGSGNNLTNTEVAKSILALLDAPLSLIQPVTDRLGHDWRYAVNWDRIKALGWQPGVNFKEGLKATIDWYRTHPK
ncbi:MAG: dTDP-glucose 4,6-dehydratase [Candidatus Ratteibacteria bacterium]|jgi:dTDP-glucose 4,6-dehydratase